MSWFSKRQELRESRKRIYSRVEAKGNENPGYTPLKEESPGHYSVQARYLELGTSSHEFEKDLLTKLRSYQPNGSGNSIVIDFSNVQEMDTSGAAVCVRAIKIAQNRGLELKFKGITGRVAGRIEILQLEGLLGLEEKKIKLTHIA